MNKRNYVWGIILISSMLSAVCMDRIEDEQKEFFTGFTDCEHELLRSASSKDPYVLLGTKEIDLFRACAKYCEQNVFADLQKSVKRLGNNMRIMRETSFNRVIWDALEVLSLQKENSEQIQNLKKSVWQLRENLQWFDFEKFGTTDGLKHAAYVCRGADNEWLSDSRAGLQDDLVTMRAQLRILISGNDVNASEVVVLGLGGAQATSMQSAEPGESIVVFGTANVGDEVIVEDVQVANDHFVGTFTFASLDRNVIGNTARGIRVQLARPPETGLFVKTILTGKQIGTGDASISESIVYIRSDGMGDDVRNEVLGNAPVADRFVFRGSFVLPAPTFVEVLFATDSGDPDLLENISLSYKVVGLDINRVISGSRVIP